MKDKRVLFILLFFLTGCMQAKQLAHLDPLLRLKGMSENGDEKNKFVEQQNKRFEQLAAVVKAGRIHEFRDKKQILEAFGEPVFTKTVTEDSVLGNGEPFSHVPAEQWLYRYATKYFNAEKIYLYFDDKGNLLRCDYVIPPAGKVASNPEEGGKGL